MAQILQPFQSAVGQLSDSINHFFGVGEPAPHAHQQVATLPVAEIEKDPHYFSAARWLQEIDSVDTSVSIRGLCSLAMLVVDAEVLRRLESSTSGASSDYSLLLLALIQKCSHAREDVASCACWALSEICESDTSVDIVLSYQSQMDRLFSTMLGMLTWTLQEAPIRAASLFGRLSRSSRFEAVLSAEVGRCIQVIRALAVLFNNSNQDVASCSMRCCWELLRGCSQGSMSLLMSVLLEEENSQLLRTLVRDCVLLLNASNSYIAIQSTLILNQILAVRDAPQLLAGLSVLILISQTCCKMIISDDAKSSFRQLPVQLQVGCLRLVLRACSDAECLAAIRELETASELMSQLQQASLASNKQVSSFATKVSICLQHGSAPETSASAAPSRQVDLSAVSNGVGNCDQPLEAAAQSNFENIFTHGKALQSAIIRESPSVFLSAAASQSMAKEFRTTSNLLVQEQARSEQLNSKVLLLELELQQKELQNQSLMDESRAVSQTLSDADAAIKHLQEDIELRDAQLRLAATLSQNKVNKDLEMESLQAELEVQKVRCNAFSEEVARLRHERLDLIKAASEMEQIKTELSTSSVLVASLRRQLLERDQVILTLQLQVSDVAQKDRELKAASDAIAKLRLEVQDKIHALDFAASSNSKLQQDLHARDQLLIVAHNQAATALETIAAVESAAGRSQGTDFAHMLGVSNQENADLRTRIVELESEVVQQSREGAFREANVAVQSDSDKRSLQQQIAALEAHFADQSQEMQRLSQAHAVVLSQYEEKLKLAAIEASASAEREMLLTAEKSGVDVHMQETLAKLQAAGASIMEASERESLLLAQKSELDAEISQLRTQITALKAGTLATSQSNWSDYAEKSALEVALEEESRALRVQLDSQLGDFQGIMEAKDHIIEQLTSQLQRLQRQVEDAQAVNQVNSNTITSQSSIIGELQSQLDRLSASKSALQSVQSSGKPVELLMELETVEEENSSLKSDIANLRASKSKLSEEVDFLRTRMSELERQATGDTRELEALHAETLHMRSLCLDLEAKISSDAQVLSSLQREKQLLVAQNSQLLAMQPNGSSNLRNSRGSVESKGNELAQITSAQRRSFSPDTELTAINHGAPRSSPHFFEPTHSSAYSSVNYAQPRASAASPTFFEAGAHDNGSSVFDVPVPESPQRVSPLYGSPRDPKRISIVGDRIQAIRRNYGSVPSTRSSHEQIDVYHA